MVLLSVAIVVYLLIGLYETRRRYAIDTANYNRLTDKVSREDYRDALVQLKTMRHDLYCLIRYAASRGCDCSLLKEWMDYKDILLRAENESVSLKLQLIPLWPGYAIEKWLKSGTYTPKGYDAEYTRMLESQLGIEEE